MAKRPPWLPDPEPITRAEIAERVGLSKAWIENAQRTRRLPFPPPFRGRDAGGRKRTLYDWHAVVAWLWTERPDLYENARRWHAGLAPLPPLRGRPAGGRTASHAAVLELAGRLETSPAEPVRRRCRVAAVR